MVKIIYLDNASTTQVDEGLRNLLFDYMFCHYGNAGSMHDLGKASKDAVEEARGRVAQAAGTNTDNVIFTSCGSEANTLAIVGLADYLLQSGKTHIITTQYEHHSVLNAMHEMERRGFNVTYLDVSAGIVTSDQVASEIQEKTGLVSVMCVNNETGAVNNLSKIYEECQQKGILFHSDCVQAFGTAEIDMPHMADMISLSGHKIHAPKGVGCLCSNTKHLLSGVMFGGKQEFGIRPGTENVAGIAAFGVQASYVFDNFDRTCVKISHISETFIDELSKHCAKRGIRFHLNKTGECDSAKIKSIRFDGIDAETLMVLLNAAGVYVSAGSACSSSIQEPSHVLKAIGLSDDEARQTIRVSFSSYNTIDEVRKAAEIISRCVATLVHLGSSQRIFNEKIMSTKTKKEETI